MCDFERARVSDLVLRSCGWTQAAGRELGALIMKMRSGGQKSEREQLDRGVEGMAERFLSFIGSVGSHIADMS